ncbi:MAG: hypothetical protein A2170_09270 [Deltaproteobacteria bacterium RBG_13_53_10]|nr:MAG: hypothetical protein A2170_09270 [Deltaproteobacteria bacterium RBG_13_53_10]
MNLRQVADWLRKIISSEEGAAGRDLTGLTRWVFRALCLVFAGFYLYLAGPHFLGTPGVGWQRGLYLLLVSVLVCIRFPASRWSPRDRISMFDGLFITASLLSFGYWIIDFDAIVMRPGSALPIDYVMGVVAVLVSLEVVRRAMGWILFGLGVTFILYALLGPYVPAPFTHAGYSISELAAYMYTLEGLFGVIADINATYITLFIIFGALLNTFGAGRFFVEFPYALTAGMTGGPAKTAVIASGMFGMISGSATANTMATGTFTIPLMKRAGYKPHVAGAIEPAASTGGMFMPPIMGAGAFLMAEFLGIPYIHIAMVSVVPALIYFFSVGVFCHLEAVKTRLPVLPRDQRANPWEIFRMGWYYLVPIVLVVVLLASGMPVSRAVYWTIMTTIGIDLIRRWRIRSSGSRKKMLVEAGRDLLRGLETGGRDVLTIGSVTGAIGGVIAVIFLTGLGFLFASSLSSLTGGSIPLAILFAFVVSYILGMGMTVTTAYILVAVLFAPAMVRMGDPPLTAHLLLLWYSQTSNVSPPVCMAAFAGAAIAKSDPYLTGFTALKYASFMLILPIMFIYTPILFPDGITVEALWSILTAFFAVVPYSAAMVGYLRRDLRPFERIILFVATGLMLTAEWITDFVGMALTGFVWYWQGRRGGVPVAKREGVDRG